SRAYLDQRLVESRPFALGTLAHAGDFVFGKDEAAASAARGVDADVLVGRLGPFQEGFEVVFHLVAGELQLVRDGRPRPRLPEHFLDLLTHGHVPSIVRDMTVVDRPPTGG